MMVTLEEEDVELMIENTFSIVVTNWETLQPTARERAQAMMDHLVKDHAAVIKEKIRLLPSLATIPQFASLEAQFRRMRADMDIRDSFQSFSSRCQHENISVVKQALTELLPFLSKNQSYLHVSALSEQPDPVLPELIRALLDACVKFASKRADVAGLCAQCIGLIGSLDPNIVEAVRDDRSTMLLGNFEDGEEAKDWVIFFLQEILLKAYMSATNTMSQALVGYAMQESLKFCGLDAINIFRAVDAETNANYRRWIALPEAVRNSLAPFLASRYIVPPTLSNTDCQYPIFPSAQTYELWLRPFVLDLLQRGSGFNAKVIFAVCSRIIRNQDIAISEFLVPFVALHVVVGDDQKQAERVGHELLGVLSYQLESDSHAEQEKLRLCSEVTVLPKPFAVQLSGHTDCCRLCFVSWIISANGCKRRRSTWQA